MIIFLVGVEIVVLIYASVMLIPCFLSSNLVSNS